jgi:hydroxyethylthiazole kinase-like uncharacterized protein yjeF
MNDVLPQSILDRLNRPDSHQSKLDNGKVLIIGGSRLFHGAPLLALKTTSRIVGMVFFTSNESSLGEVATKLKCSLNSFIWIRWAEVDEYIAKADVILIGPGMMRERSNCDGPNIKCSELDKQGWETRNITEKLLEKYPEKQWVIDAGSLQVMEAKYIPKKAILTPNRKELGMLFGKTDEVELRGFLQEKSREYQCTIVSKDNGTIIVSPEEILELKLGNVGMNKGGMGDVLAGIAAGLAAKNPPFVAACVAAFVNQQAAENLYQRVGFAYNADDLAEEAPKVLGEFWR